MIWLVSLLVPRSLPIVLRPIVFLSKWVDELFPSCRVELWWWPGCLIISMQEASDVDWWSVLFSVEKYFVFFLLSRKFSWGRSHLALFLCDQYRGPNINNRDHLVGQLAKESLLFPRLTVPGACVFTVASDPGKEQQKTRRRHDALSVMSRKQKTLKNADVAQTKNCGKVDGALQRIV